MLKITDNIKLGKLVGSSGSTGSGGSGGSSNYNDLTNKPSINGVSLTGDKTSLNLGIVDLRTSSPQYINSALHANGQISSKEQFSLDNVNGENRLKINYADNTELGNVVTLSGSDEISLFIAPFKEVFFLKNPMFMGQTTLADLPDNALLTKAQVQEMINNALNNS